MDKIDFPEEWFETSMPEGVWKRFRHPSCSEGKNKALAIAKTGQGWVWHCHRCEQHGFKSAENLSPQRTMDWIKSAKEKPQVYKRDIKLPEDFTVTIPLKGKAWLYGKGITDEQIKRYNFGYSSHYDRVILPVYEHIIAKKLIFWEGRYLGTPDRDHPKYMKVSESNRKDIYFIADGNKSETVVLVEDILSAVRVGEVTDCYAMLYAFVPDIVVWTLSKLYKNIIIWLDPDKQSDMVDYVLRYRSFGLNVHIMISALDPKCYTAGEIERRVNG